MSGKIEEKINIPTNRLTILFEGMLSEQENFFGLTLFVNIFDYYL